VLFSNGTTIAQDNANLFWDDTNNRLGIGTVSPAVRLQINQSTSFDGIRILSSNATTQNTLALYHDDTKAVIETTYLGSGAFKSLCLNTQGGNVLIGTTTDSGYKLDVNGTANIGTNLFVQSDALFYSRIRLQTNASYYQAGTIGYNSVDGNYIWAKTGSSNNFTILNDSGSSVFTLASTGAATFSSSVGVGISPQSILETFGASPIVTITDSNTFSSGVARTSGIEFKA